VHYVQYFEHVEEMEWAIEVATSTSLPVAATMCIGPDGDMHGVSTGDCAVRMAKAGKRPHCCKHDTVFNERSDSPVAFLTLIKWRYTLNLRGQTRSTLCPKKSTTD